MAKQNKEASKVDALLGGRDIQITLPDGSTETVFVRQVKASELIQFTEVLDHEVKLIQMTTGKDIDWIDSLSLAKPDEYSKLADAVNEVNLDFFASWFRRQRNRKMSLSVTGNPAR